MDRDEKLIYENERGQQIEFSIWSPFFSQDIDGISGLNNIIYNNKGIGQDGSTYTGSTLDNRNIVIQGAIMENKKVNREKLLSIINPKLKTNKLIYTDGSIKKYVECIVENAPVITKENKPKFQISLLCPDPYWKDYIDSKANIALWKGDFHFPLTIPQTGITMGHREPSLIVNVENKGQVKTGMRIEFKARGTLKNPSLFNVNTREFIKISKGMVAGEKIIINTNQGNKKIVSILNGVTTDILNYIDIKGGGNTFLQLDPGDNLLRYDADEGLDNLEVSIYYNNNYLGV